MIDGEQLFHLHDTYGCPPDLIIDILRERPQPAAGAVVQYEQLMEQQRERARGASKFAGSVGLPAELVATLAATEFMGYETLETLAAIVALVKDGKPVDAVLPATRGW